MSKTQIGSRAITKKMFGTREVLKEVLNGSVVYQKSSPASAYTMGFRGMSTSGPSLTRTGDTASATWTATNGIITFDGIDISKIWGGYVGNDGEELTFNSADNKYYVNGSEYTGNKFSKINRFFAKPYYEEVSGVQVLDGFDLVFADTNPDPAEYQDWFLGKAYAIFGCYKAKNINGSSALVSKQGITYSSSVNANNIVASYKLNSSTAFNLHEKWYNENAIMQVLFMAIFATRQTEDVFPQGTYRYYNDGQATGICDNIRGQSLFGYTTSGGSGANANLFLGLEDFVGFGYELVAGVKLSGTNIQPSLDYANFAYSNTYSNADVNISAITSGNYIKSLQCSEATIGLLIPKTDTGNSSTATDYFCDKCWHGQNCWYQGARDPAASFGVFCFRGAFDASSSHDSCAGRLCGNPV